jgi:hypothetical protein
VKEIPLTQGKVAYVDDKFYVALQRRGAWHAERQHQIWYASRTEVDSTNKKHTIYMHSLVWKLANRKPTRELDHQNHNGCDNQLSNLRSATRSQQLQNCRKRQHTTSRFKGVSWSQKTEKWQVFIRRRYLGLRIDEKVAAQLYDDAAKKLYGAFACLNFPESTE